MLSGTPAWTRDLVQAHNAMWFAEERLRNEEDEEAEDDEEVEDSEEAEESEEAEQ